MQSIDENPPQDFVASFALQRQRLLHHVGTILSGEAPQAEPESVSRLSQMLMTSLELLKVAEEELRDERRTNAVTKAAHERRLAHLQAMFDVAPSALVLTTTDTTIREANHAAGQLLGRNPYQLVGMQLSKIVARAQYAGFREQLAHVIEAGEAAAWSFTLDVHRAPPAVVSCSVRIVDDPAVGNRALYWCISPAHA